MRDGLITALEALALLLMAAGVGLGLCPFIGWGALTLAGAIVMGGARWADGARPFRLRKAGEGK